jgi:hypothetical protein
MKIGDREIVVMGVKLIKIRYIHVWNTKATSLPTINIQLKNKGQEGITGLFCEEGTNEEGGEMEKVKDDEFGRCTYYTYMKIEFSLN